MCQDCQDSPSRLPSVSCATAEATKLNINELRTTDRIVEIIVEMYLWVCEDLRCILELQSSKWSS